MNEITIQNICKKFSNMEVLSNINLTFKKGKVYGFFGHNGCGKTVFFKILLGLYSKTSGSIFVDSKEKNNDFMENVGALIETPGYLGNLTGYENLHMLYRINNKKNGDSLIVNIMNEVGLGDYIHTKVKKYSLGMRQRLGIAQAVMESPHLLILDEPFNALDSKWLEYVINYLLKIKDDKIILIATHQNIERYGLFDEKIYLEHGRIISHEK